jgi:acyl-coenzyme A thioesterase PaaI-like protein
MSKPYDMGSEAYTMTESRETTRQRLYFNFFPCYRACGAKVLYIAADWRTVKIELGLNWLTKNYVGTIFGGSMFAATDPMYMIMLIKLLGKDFIVWDKAASIKFLKPGTDKLFATFSVSDQDLSEIHESLSQSKKLERTFTVTLVDKEDKPHAIIERLVYIRRKPA